MKSGVEELVSYIPPLIFPSDWVGSARKDLWVSWLSPLYRVFFPYANVNLMSMCRSDGF